MKETDSLLTWLTLENMNGRKAAHKLDSDHSTVTEELSIWRNWEDVSG